MALVNDIFDFALTLASGFEGDFAHFYGPGRTDVVAQQTADAFLLVDGWQALVDIPLDRLMSAIIAGYVAASAFNAFIDIYLRIDFVIDRVLQRE